MQQFVCIWPNYILYRSKLHIKTFFGNFWNIQLRSQTATLTSKRNTVVEGQLSPCPCLVPLALHFIKRSGNRQDVGRPSVTTDDRTGKYLAHADFPLFCVNKVVKISVTGYLQLEWLVCFFQINSDFLIYFTYFLCQITNCS